MITVDASVWIAMPDKADVFHAPSMRFGQCLQQRGLALFGPAFVVVETGCAIARKRRDGAKGAAAAATLWRISTLRLVDGDSDLLALSLKVGTESFLRSSDALYAATAERTSSQLVTWDVDQLKRAGVRTPSAWLAANL